MTTKQENQLPSDPPGDEGNEGTERGDAILRRMLKTPPKLHKDMKKGKPKPDTRDEKTKRGPAK